ncbi:hypothetical protein I551_7264 [Mycobacterium ulcerans str. Harvey]|uniref:Uncharacterized protein n=1 Tax=Mycobacterium ulcerans str. Harvey TaxID=1299332 RepID=A0ABN0QNQ1_MYCUL|nr:hypothetical protein I551_7264 [Mycobacterium ulcerans str. Harvey]
MLAWTGRPVAMGDSRVRRIVAVADAGGIGFLWFRFIT